MVYTCITRNRIYIISRNLLSNRQGQELGKGLAGYERDGIYMYMYTYWYRDIKSHAVGCDLSTVHSPSIPPCLAPVSDHPVSLIHTLRPISRSIVHVHVGTA